MGTTSADGKIQYTIIRTNEDLLDYLLAGGEDLPYALRKESKRQRYVWNSEAMRRNLQKATTEALNQMEKEIIAWINRDVSEYIAQTTTDVLNTISFDGTQFVAKPRKEPKHWAERLGEQFGRALGNAIWDIFDDTMNGRR